MKKPQFSKVFNISMYFLNHDRNLQRITRLEENFVILIKKTKAKKKQCMHCFLQYGQGCMWRFSVIHLLRPHGSAYGGWKKLACFAFFNDYLKNKISD